MMNKETRHEQTPDPLSRWWWPGQWLRIVYAVWVDQVWYWQNVRPRLRDQKQAWGLLMQSLLGAMVVSLVLAAIMRKILVGTSEEVDWNSLIFSVAIGVVFFGVSISACIWLMSKRMDLLLPFSTTSFLMLGLWFGVTNNDNIVVRQMVMFVFACSSFGLSYGISDVLMSGVIENSSAITRVAWAGVVVGIKSGKISQAVIAIVTASLGYYFGGRWATRQIPDEETRKWLAGADASPAES